MPPVSDKAIVQNLMSGKELEVAMQKGLRQRKGALNSFK